MAKISKQFKIIISLVIWLALLPVVCFAAELYLEPIDEEYYLGSAVITEIRLDAEDECVNTVKVDLNFSKDNLQAVDFSQGNSILSIWLKEPAIEQESGQISFIGGIPGGFCGIIPGDAGKSNLLGRVIFKIYQKASEQAEINFLDSSEVLLNDGLGTKADLKTSGIIFSILDEIPYKFKDQWQEELVQDKVLPELFEIKISQEPSIFEGKYFITFLTADKQTGIDYYEIDELNLIERIFKKEKWQKANSPYLLKDQSLRSLIKVKAVDKAGNERIAEIMPELKFGWRDIIWILLILIILGISFWIIKRKK